MVDFKGASEISQLSARAKMQMRKEYNSNSITKKTNIKNTPNQFSEGI